MAGLPDRFRGPLREFRWTVLLPIVLCLISLILSFLCVFAGSSRNYMESYAVLTLNTSRIGVALAEDVGQGVDSIIKRDIEPRQFSEASSLGSQATSKIESAASRVTSDVHSAATSITSAVAGAASTVESRLSPNAITSAIGSAASDVESEASQLASDAENEAHDLIHEAGEELTDELEKILKDIGLKDWYSVHILDFCEGYYLPGPVPNATTSRREIYKNVTSCSNRTAEYHFDPKQTLAEQLQNKTDGKINLTSLHWPEDIDHALNGLKDAQKAVYVLYCFSISFIFLALVMAAVALFSQHKIVLFANAAVDGFAFLMIAISSAIISVIAVDATDAINEFGKDVGISATKGNKFLALTWTATVLVFLSSIYWCYELVTRLRARLSRESYRETKYG